MQYSSQLYSELGGQSGIEATVQRLYEKVLEDESLKHYFANSDVEEIKKHQTILLSWALGGAERYTGREMTAAHSGLHIKPKDYETFIRYLTSTLNEQGASQGSINEVLEKLASMKNSIVYH